MRCSKCEPMFILKLPLTPAQLNQKSQNVSHVMKDCITTFQSHKGQNQTQIFLNSHPHTLLLSADLLLDCQRKFAHQKEACVGFSLMLFCFIGKSYGFKDFVKICCEQKTLFWRVFLAIDVKVLCCSYIFCKTTSAIEGSPVGDP